MQILEQCSVGISVCDRTRSATLEFPVVNRVMLYFHFVFISIIIYYLLNLQSKEHC